MADIRDFSPGWSIARLADEFGMDRRTAAKRLREAGVPPSGKRGTNDIYRLADAAPALVSPSGASGSEQVIDPRDLPPMERRAYYQSENERLKVETTTGLLVPAAEVEADYAELVKKVVQFFDTLPDVLERKLSLSPEQVIKAQEECDRVRQSMYEAISDEPVRDRA
ncbi:DUF1441 family protein [Xanthomonas campestris pv. uppalii]|uniref:DUF1441 family protein n=1 Tax=Xanthomonas euvesicatoria TaxID=456327 RepID=UPI001C4379E2|nr:DUF1441 family protein [Xanthomonas euvesicatoria]MBV6785935.1 DUF1441 family protein [Xanthomonas campestris pv. uppalii]MBV6794305.1 DUF1441 family protein [Xanthomonas campestris pv. daturae]